MDPLSLAASVVAVLQAANSVISVCYDFRAAIKNAPWALSRITNSVNELRLVLSSLEQVANDSEGDPHPSAAARLPTLQALCHDGGALDGCFRELTALEQKLAPPSWAVKAGSKRRALMQSLGWQFKEKDAEKTLKVLEEYKSILILAVTVDQTALITAMHKTMDDIDQNTTSMYRRFQDMTSDDRRRNILRWLSPCDPATSHKAALAVHQAGTNDWFLSCNQFEAWREAENSFLWLSGFPGSGKTILMSTVINFFQQCSDPILIAYFYCDFRKPETQHPLNLAGSLIAQICSQLGAFPKILQETFDSGKESSSSFKEQIDLETASEILTLLASQHRVRVVVDALDECGKRSDVLELFSRLGRQNSRLNILLSSRDDADIRQSFSDFPRMCLEVVSSHLDRDIDCYVSYRLDHNKDFRWLKPSFKHAIQESLRTQAKGMFRWVQCQLDHIAELKTMKDIREALGNLPEGLHETYENILMKVAAGSVRLVKQTLQWLVCDVSTLTLTELHECLAIELDMAHIDEEAQMSSPMDIYDLCGSLIAVTAEDEAIIAHLSVKDYLFSDAIKSGPASKFALSESQANAENAMSCLTYLSFAELRLGPASSGIEFKARLLRHPFLAHASTWWASYTRNAGSSSEELNRRALEFLSPPCRPQFMSWLQVICSYPNFNVKYDYRKAIGGPLSSWRNYPVHATSLYYAASFGLEHVVRALLQQGAEVDAAGGRLGATAFHAAALRGHVQIMDILLQQGADPNQKDLLQKTPLHSAAMMGNVEAIKYLLEHGADIAARDQTYRTPLSETMITRNAEASGLLQAAMELRNSRNGRQPL